MSKTTRPWKELLQWLHAVGILRDLDLHLVQAVARTHGISENAASAGAMALALASRALGEGHVCLDLGAVDAMWVASPGNGPGGGTRPDGRPEDVDTICREIGDSATRDALFTDWIAAVGHPGEDKPFLLDDPRLYVRRMRDYEAQVAARLLEMARTNGEGKNLPLEIEQRVRDLLSDESQQSAARGALTRRLTIITGAPGTGKTYTVARILALLSQQPSRDATTPPLHVRLAAPTGKAAARMEESIRQARNDVACAFHAGLRIEPACTLERLLGFQRNSPYFQHDAGHPLEADVVLIDEASMIDLAKMAKLLDAIGKTTRLVLLGDRHQLASVQPGSVLAELCESKALAACVADLTTSRRFPPGSPVDRLSRAVHKADTEMAAREAWQSMTQSPGDPSGDGSVRIQPVSPRLSDGKKSVEPEFARSIREGYREFLASETPADAFRALDRFRILCALRHGPFGTIAINKLVEIALSEDHRVTGLETLPRPLHPAGTFYSHRVVMMTRNDYAIRLFNGDVGVILPEDPQHPGGNLVAFFAQETTASGKDPGFRKIPCRLLPEHETAFAMTIHKSQGSEFQRILVLLPHQDCPVLTRELLYTAITRTRKGVELWCGQKTFVRTALRRVRRFSGLGNLLDQNAEPEYAAR